MTGRTDLLPPQDAVQLGEDNMARCCSADSRARLDTISAIG
jgi:hypothetical protein